VLVGALSSLSRTRAALQLENLALPHQIGVLQRSVKKRPKLTTADRGAFRAAVALAESLRGARDRLDPPSVPRSRDRLQRSLTPANPPFVRRILSSIENSLVPGQGPAGTASGATAGEGASRGSSAGRRPPPSLRKRGGVSSAAPLPSCGTGVLRALFLAKRTSGAVRPCGHRRSEAPRNPPVPFTPLGFRESFASKLAEPNCGRCRIGFPIGTDKQKIAQMLRGPGRFRLKIKSRFSRRCI